MMRRFKFCTTNCSHHVFGESLSWLAAMVS